jgi:hypothetical protein
MREGTIFQLALKPKEFPAGLRLRNVEWGVLFAIDGTAPIGQIRRVFALEDEEIEVICGILIQNGLIKEKPVSLSEYMAAQTAASGKKSLTLLEMLQGGTAIRALTMDTGKGAPIKPAAAPTGMTTLPGAKLTPPPLPPEALMAITPNLTGRLPEDQEPPAEVIIEPAPVSGPLLPPVAPALPAGSSNGNGHATAATLLAPPPAFAPQPSPSYPGAFTPLPTPGAPLQTATDTAAATATVITPEPVEPVLEATLSPDLSVEDLPGEFGDVSPALSEVVPIVNAPTPASASSRKRLSLKNVIEFILTRADDVNAGQLDVYRVFIRVNTRLLKRNGVHSLRFEEDRLITDAELQDAILNSVERTLGIPCPPAVFV